MASGTCAIAADPSAKGEQENKLNSLLDVLRSVDAAGRHKLIEELLMLELKTSEQYFKRASFVMRSAENSHGLYASSVMRDCEAGNKLTGGYKYEDELLSARMHYAWWHSHDSLKVANFSDQLLKKYPTEKNYLESARVNEIAGNISRAREELQQACKLTPGVRNLTALAVFYAKDRNYRQALQVLDSAVKKFPLEYQCRIVRAAVLCLLNNTKELEQELSTLRRMGKATSLGFVEARAQRLALGHTQIENTSLASNPDLSALDLSRRIESLESRGSSVDHASQVAEQLDLGQSYAIAGDPERSIQYFLKLLKTAPENYLFHYYLSAAYHAKGDVARARDERKMSLVCYQKQMWRKTARPAAATEGLSP